MMKVYPIPFTLLSNPHSLQNSLNFIASKLTEIKFNSLFMIKSVYNKKLNFSHER